MNTRKNNNILARVKEPYFLEGANNDNKASMLPLDVKLVGGTIFYIDDEVDGKYEFFDADGNLIENVQIGDKPYAYRTVREGSKDKYYAYHDEIYSNLRWTYCRDKDYVYESLGTSNDIGSGKINTETVMTKDGGAYITANSNGRPTIWYQLQQVRNTKVGGCDDWFVSSTAEVIKLRDAIKSGIITGGTIAGSSYVESVFINKWFWSSSEFSDRNAWYWYYYYQQWDFSSKYDSNSVFFTRAF